MVMCIILLCFPRPTPGRTLPQFLPKLLPQFLPKLLPQFLPKLLPQFLPKLLPQFLPKLLPQFLPKLHTKSSRFRSSSQSLLWFCFVCFSIFNSRRCASRTIRKPGDRLWILTSRHRREPNHFRIFDSKSGRAGARKSRSCWLQLIQENKVWVWSK